MQNFFYLNIKNPTNYKSNLGFNFTGRVRSLLHANKGTSRLEEGHS